MARVPGFTLAGATLTVGVLALAAFAPWLAPFDPFAIVGPPSLPPGGVHGLGTNDIGQDLMSELVYGARASLTVGLATGLMATGVGTAVGLLAGVRRGLLSSLLLRLVDVVLVLPFLPLVIVLAAYVGTTRWQVAALLGSVMWAQTARLTYAVTRAEMAADHVLAAHAAGARPLRVLLSHVRPALAPLCTVRFTQTVGMAIALESSLAFLGLGDPTAKSWGTMLSYAQARNAFLTGQWPWWVVPPGLMIASSVLGFTLLGLGRERNRRTP